MQAEKNLAWEAAQQQAQAQAQLNAMGAQAGSGPCKLLVTNLNVQLAVSLLSLVVPRFPSSHRLGAQNAEQHAQPGASADSQPSCCVEALA